MPTRHRLRMLANRLWDVAGAVSIRTKILGIVLGLVLLLGLGVTVQVRALLISTLQARLQEQSVSITRDVAARATDLILINDLFSLHQLLRDTQANNSDVRYAFILDSKGQVIAHTFGEGFPVGLVEANECSACGHHRTVAVMTDEGRIWDTAVPIFEGRAGTARVGLSETSLNRTVNAVTAQLLLTTVLVSAVGIAAAVLLTWVLTRPILSLVEATQAVGRGDLSRRVEVWADDEIGALAAAFNAMIADLAQAEQARAERDQLRMQLLEKVISAQEEERKRIARELHDETGQAITTLIVGLRALMEQCPSPAMRTQAEELRTLAASTLEGVRNLALELRPSVLDDLGLVAALERYIADYRVRHRLTVDFVTRGLQHNRLPPPVETAIYRIVQESLTNVVRHAQANTVSVLLEERKGKVRVIVEDDGRGFDPEAVRSSTQRLGLYGMQERVGLLGGTFVVESKPGAGTSIFVEIPTDLPQDAAAPQALPAAPPPIEEHHG